MDISLILEIAEQHEIIVTVEENALQGGAGSAINEFLNGQDSDSRVRNLGIPDEFIGHGNHEEQLAESGLDTAGILKAISKTGRAQVLVQGEQAQEKRQHLNG